MLVARSVRAIACLRCLCPLSRTACPCADALGGLFCSLSREFLWELSLSHSHTRTISLSHAQTHAHSPFLCLLSQSPALSLVALIARRHSRSQGLFGGVSLEASTLIERKDANRDFYNQEIRAVRILNGGPYLMATLLRSLVSRSPRWLTRPWARRRPTAR